MTNAGPYQNRIELLQGTLDMLILQALKWSNMHGYLIAQTIRLKSGELLQVETGSLYPALHRLERQKWVKSEWKLTTSRQRASFTTSPKKASSSWRPIMRAGRPWCARLPH
jgi:PadR family transcriptional regulator PadR